jgi:hypothetical protein
LSRLRRLLRLLPWGCSLLVGALFPAALFALLEGNWYLFTPAFAVSGLHALILGAPALAWYREHDGRRLLPVLACGYLIGALPIGSAMMLGGDLRESGAMMQLGLEVMAVAGGFGTLGALACWLTLFVTRQFRPADEARTLDELADRG